MAIQVGDKIPDVKLKAVKGEGKIEDVSTASYFAGRKVVVFALPGAFTPTCSAKHLPGFVSQIDAIKAKGVDEVCCLSVNDFFVMEAWAKDQGALGKVTMLADGNAELAKATGLTLDVSAHGMGLRSNRYAAILDDGVVKTLNVEGPGKFEVSSAEAVLAAL